MSLSWEISEMSFLGPCRVHHTPIITVAGDTALDPPVVRVMEEPSDELGGSVTVLDSTGAKLKNGPELVRDDCAQIIEAAGRKITKSDEKKGTCGQLIIDCTPNKSLQTLFDEHDARKALSKSVSTTGDESFVRVCKRLGLDFELHGLYRDWLINERGLEAARLPIEGYSKR